MSCTWVSEIPAPAWAQASRQRAWEGLHLKGEKCFCCNCRKAHQSGGQGFQDGAVLSRASHAAARSGEPASDGPSQYREGSGEDVQGTSQSHRQPLGSGSWLRPQCFRRREQAAGGGEALGSGPESTPLPGAGGQVALRAVSQASRLLPGHRAADNQAPGTNAAAPKPAQPRPHTPLHLPARRAHSLVHAFAMLVPLLETPLPTFFHPTLPP